LTDLVARRVDGIIAMPGGLPQETVRTAIAAGVPVVWCMWEDEDGDLTPAVGFDYYGAGRLVAEHLVGLGHGRVGIVAHHNAPGRTVHEHRLRVAGCREGLAAAGCPLDDSLLAFGDSTIDSGYAAGRALLALSAPPSAIFATNDLMALGVLGAATDLGLSVPADLSIVGFDNIMGAAYTSPPLTTVNIDTATIMATATTLLLDVIGDKEPEAPPLALPTLVVRGSTSVYERKG
jgi:DNA-binding LacI/PurR family transcriptional regulator